MSKRMSYTTTTNLKVLEYDEEYYNHVTGRVYEVFECRNLGWRKATTLLRYF